MPDRFRRATKAAAIAAASVFAAQPVSFTRASAQSPGASATAISPTLTLTTPVLKTPWGEPDLQGIWTQESDIPLQRLPKYAGQEYFTEAQRAELDRERTAMLERDGRGARGSEADVTA